MDKYMGSISGSRPASTANSDRTIEILEDAMDDLSPQVIPLDDSFEES